MLQRMRPVLPNSGGFLMCALASSSRISPFLWFDSNAEEAVDFYLSIFENSRKLEVLRNNGVAPGPKDGVLTIAFELDGAPFTALNGGPAHSFTDTGRGSPRAARRWPVAGCAIGSGSPGRWFRRGLRSCFGVRKRCRP